MALESAQGVIIRLMDYSETSQIATFLTDWHGKVSAIAKGSKRAKSSTGGAMDMLTLNEIVFSTSASEGLATLREAHVIRQFPAAHLSALHYYAALYFAELSDIFGEGSEGSRRQFDLLVESLQALASAGGDVIGNLIAFFETHILEISGLAPSFGRCVACGHEPPERGDLRISIADGGILCPTCPGGVKIAPATLAALRRVVESTLQSVQRLRLTGNVAAELGGVLSAMIVEHAHRVPRLLKFVRPDYDKYWKRWSTGAGFEVS